MYDQCEPSSTVGSELVVLYLHYQLQLSGKHGLLNQSCTSLSATVWFIIFVNERIIVML